MKKSFTFFITVILAFGLVACNGNVAKVDIDYGTSKNYSKSDMDTAIELIIDEFATWEGCKLHSIHYSSDECNSEENIKWINDLGDENTEFIRKRQIFLHKKSRYQGPPR